MILSKRYAVVTYIAFAIVMSLGVSVYVSLLNPDEAVGKWLALGGPAIGAYLLGTSGWVDVSGSSSIVGFMLCGVAWVFAWSRSGLVATVAALVGGVAWVSCGSFLMAVSFYA